MTRLRRAWGALLLLLFVVGQGYSALHHALVEHRICPVDGVLAHGDHDHGPGDELAEEGSGEEATLVLAVPSDAHGHDEHCTAPTSRSPRKWLHESPRLVAEPLPTGVRTAPSVVAVRVTGVPVFRLAPKQSPPDVA